MSIIYFGRHGRVGNDGNVSSDGFKELWLIRNRLKNHRIGFEVCLCSTTNRAIQTGQFLSTGLNPTTLSMLHAYSDRAQRVGVATADGLRWQSECDYTTETLGAISKIVPADKPLMIIGHDQVAMYLAKRYLEQRGVTIDGDIENGRFPDQGEGILVQGTNYTFFRHKDKEGVS